MAESTIESTGGGKDLAGGRERGSAFTPKVRTFAARRERQKQILARQKKARAKAKTARGARKRQRAAR